MRAEKTAKKKKNGARGWGSRFSILFFFFPISKSLWQRRFHYIFFFFNSSRRSNYTPEIQNTSHCDPNERDIRSIIIRIFYARRQINSVVIIVRPPRVVRNSYSPHNNYVHMYYVHITMLYYCRKKKIKTSSSIDRILTNSRY